MCTEASASFMPCVQRPLPAACRMHRGLCQLHAVCTEVSDIFMSCLQKYLPPLCRVYRRVCHLHVVYSHCFSIARLSLPPPCRVYSLTSWSTATVFQLHVCLCHLHVVCTEVSATFMSCLQPDFVIYSHCFSVARLSLPPSCNGVVRVCTDFMLTVQGGCLMGQSVLISC